MPPMSVFLKPCDTNFMFVISLTLVAMQLQHILSSPVPGSREDILASQARAMGEYYNHPFSSSSFQVHASAAATAAAALVAPMRASLVNTTYCKAALLQYEFSNALLPARSPLLDVFESLRLDVDCGVTPPNTLSSSSSSSSSSPTTTTPQPLPGSGWDARQREEYCLGGQYVVDSINGNDNTTSNYTSIPFHTIAAALDAVLANRRRLAGKRENRSNNNNNIKHHHKTSCIVLRSGTHYLTQTINLTAEHNNIAFVADAENSFSSDAAPPSWISGGIALEGLPPWEQRGTTPGGDPIWVTTLPPSLAAKIAAMPSLNSFAPLTRLSNSQFPNYNIETETNEVFGPWEGGGCVVEWVKPALYPLPTVFWKNLTGLKNDSAMDCYNHYSTGTGGPCAHWKGDLGGSGHYYCGNSSGGGWVEVDANMQETGLMLYPLAMVVNTSALAVEYDGKSFNTWQIPNFTSYDSQPTLTVWMGAPGGGGGWYNNRFAITEYDVATSTMNLSLDNIWPAGGWQGGRTWHTLDAPQGTHNGPLMGGSWHVNGIFAELDAPGEYFFNTFTKELFFIWNTSLVPPLNKEGKEKKQEEEKKVPPSSSGPTPPPASLLLVAPQLEVLFNLTGTPEDPVQDISFVGLGFRDQKDGFLEDWMVPSGGDWALRRAGAITLRRTERILVSNCAFVRTDGTAIHLDKYNRNATIEDNEFVWLGMSAVTLLGDTLEDDATLGTQPYGTLLLRNLVHEIGILEKQSSALFLGKSAFTRAENNVFFNGPRAMINVNDYMGGGDNFTSNAIWNTCKESGDHGPMNSWNRQPFQTSFATGEPSYRGLHSETSYSFIFANFGGSQAFDNDDGSAFFYTHDNAFYMADGAKDDYGGYNSIFANNVVAVRHYDGQSCFNLIEYVDGFETQVYGNKCILPPEGSGNDPNLVDSNIGPDACTGGGPGTAIIHDNSYYTTSGMATIMCGNGSTVSILDVEAPVEERATVGVTPSDDTLMGWFREKLRVLDG